jgi:hypothetical protein
MARYICRKTDSRFKLRVHFVKNSLFSQRDNKRRRAVLNNYWYKTTLVSLGGVSVKV